LQLLWGNLGSEMWSTPADTRGAPVTLVLQYLDATRFIAVAVTRITVTDEDDTIIARHDHAPSKAFLVKPCWVSYSGLSTPNSYGDEELTTVAWVPAHPSPPSRASTPSPDQGQASSNN
jgi:hypothetical protein